MAYDLDDLDETPTKVTVGKRQFTCSRLRLRHIGQVKRHIASQRPNPIKLIKGELDGLTEKQQDALLARAYDDYSKSLKVTEADVDAYTATLEGTVFMLWLCAKDHEPDLTIEEVEATFNCMSASDMETFTESLERALGDEKRPTGPPGKPAVKRPGQKFTSSFSRKKAGRRKSS
jgi:hypothetical protein